MMSETEHPPVIGKRYGSGHLYWVLDSILDNGVMMWLRPSDSMWYEAKNAADLPPLLKSQTPDPSPPEPITRTELYCLYRLTEEVRRLLSTNVIPKDYRVETCLRNCPQPYRWKEILE